MSDTSLPASEGAAKFFIIKAQTMKHILLTLLAIVSCAIATAQTRDASRDMEALIYTAPREAVVYGVSTPYWPQTWQEGSVRFRGVTYTGLKLRTDIRTGRLCVLSLFKGVSLDYKPDEVDRVVIADTAYVYLNKQKGFPGGWVQYLGHTPEGTLYQRPYIAYQQELKRFVLKKKRLLLTPDGHWKSLGQKAFHQLAAQADATPRTTDTPLAPYVWPLPAPAVAVAAQRGAADAADVQSAAAPAEAETADRAPSAADDTAAPRSEGLMGGTFSEAKATARRTARIDNVRSLQMGTNQLAIEEMITVPMVLGELDVLKIVQTLPGVKNSGEGSSGISVRGGATDQNLILWGGNTIYNPTHLFGIFSVFNGNVVSDLTLYKGNIPARYGGRIASVLDIQPRAGRKDKFGADLTLGLLTSSATLEGPLSRSHKTSFIASARTTYSDWMLSLLPEKSGYRNGRAGFYDVNLGLDHRFDDRNLLRLNGYCSHDRFNFVGTQRYAYSNANASVDYLHNFSPLFYTDVAVGMDHYDYDTSEFGTVADSYTLDYAIDQYFATWHFSHHDYDAHHIQWGAEGRLYDVMPGRVAPYTDGSLYVGRRLDSESAIDAALYASEDWAITQALSLGLGARFNLFSATGRSAHLYCGPEFRAALRYAFARDFSVKASAGSQRQNIHRLTNTLVASPTDVWKLSDADIRPQTGLQYSLGLYKNFEHGNIECSLEGYYRTMDHYLDYRAGARLLMNPHLAADVVETRGRAYGVELLVKRTEGRVNGWISYAYSRTRQQQRPTSSPSPRERGEAATASIDEAYSPLPRREEQGESPLINGGRWYNAAFDKPHEFKFVGNYRFTQRYSVSLNAEYSTGRPLTVPIARFYDHTIGSYSFFYSDRNAVRVPDYFRMDVGFTAKQSHHLTSKCHVLYTLGCYNVTGRRNAYSIYYQADEGNIHCYRMSVFGAPIPYFSVNLKF